MYYRDFGSWMREIFPFKVQKISLALPAPIGTEESPVAAVPSATTALSILRIAIPNRV